MAFNAAQRHADKHSHMVDVLDPQGELVERLIKTQPQYILLDVPPF